MDPCAVGRSKSDISTLIEDGPSKITAIRGPPSVQLPFKSRTVLTIFVQVEPLDHLIVLFGARWPVYVLSSGKVTLIVDASTTDPCAVGRWNSDMSTVSDLKSTEMAALWGLPSVQLPLRMSTVVIVFQSAGKPGSKGSFT